MTHFAFAAALRGPGAIAAYDAHHAAPWPEVLAGIRRIGVTRMQIFRRDSNLVMLIDADGTFDADAAFARLIEDPVCRRWDDLMRDLQVTPPDDPAGAVWQQLVSIFDVRSDELMY